jgi:hypothetical protein
MFLSFCGETVGGGEAAGSGIKIDAIFHYIFPIRCCTEGLK